MTRRRKILLLLAGLVLAVGVYMLFIRETEPTYKGRKLSEWVRFDGRFLQMPREAPEAVRAMGDKAVPFLLRWIDYDTPEWRKQLNAFCVKHPTFKRLASDEKPKFNLARGATEAFSFLGPEGQKIAKVALVRRLQRERRPGNRVLAYRALTGLGPDMFPYLIAGLKDKDDWVRMDCALRISGYGTNALSAVPALIGCLTDTYSTVRARSAVTLGWLKLEPDLVLPALIKAINDTDARVRYEAVTAIGLFGPVAESAVPGFWKAFKDPSVEVRRAATNTLYGIRPCGQDSPVPWDPVPPGESPGG